MEENEKENREIRHTINATETFTLAKDVFDLRCLIKNIYNNRAQIRRRLNILSLSVSFVFTLLYVAYILFTGLSKDIGINAEIALYCILGVYAVTVITLSVLTLCGFKAKAKNIRKINRAMSIIRFIVRLSSVALAIAALVFATAGKDASASSVALNILVIIFSVICLIVQSIPLIFGGFGKLARWLLSPVKIKYRFSTVALEWYELAVTDASDSKTIKRIARRYYDDIGRCLDNTIIPALGKKYISSIKPSAILSLTENVLAEDRALVEGILKNIFAYATECGYVTFDPCRDLGFNGSIEEEEKPAGGVKSRLLNIGKKIGKSVLDKYIDKTVSDD